jgi:hypothetical protein
MARSLSGGPPPPSRAPEDPFKTASQKASSGPALERRSLCTPSGQKPRASQVAGAAPVSSALLLTCDVPTVCRRPSESARPVHRAVIDMWPDLGTGTQTSSIISLAPAAGAACGGRCREQQVRGGQREHGNRHPAAVSEVLALAIANPDLQVDALARVAQALAQAGQHEQAENTARTITNRDRRADALTLVAHVLAEGSRSPRPSRPKASGCRSNACVPCTTCPGARTTAVPG